MTKCRWIIALFLASSAAAGCGGDPAEEAAATAAQTGADSGTAASEEVQVSESAVTYISYGSLNGNKAPCPPNQVLNTSTKKCVPTPASIYRRGCTAQTRCARG